MPIVEKALAIAPTQLGAVERLASESVNSVVDFRLYRGNAEKIVGLQRTNQVLGNIPGISVVSPVVFLSDAYEQFKKRGTSDDFLNTARAAWNYLNGEYHTLIVRRCFPDKDGKTQSGPRSGNVTNFEAFCTALNNLYGFYDLKYADRDDVLPELMIHKMVDTGNPPKNSDPFLPFPGGDVIPIGPGRYQIRARYGASESAKGFETDRWEVEVGDVSARIGQTYHAHKLEAKIPSVDESYQKLEIAPKYQDVPALNHVQVHALAQTCHNLTQEFGPHRFEFDGSLISGEEKLFVIEAAPFIVIEQPRENLVIFEKPKIQPLLILKDESDFEKIPKDSIVFVYLPPSHFRGDNTQKSINRLSSRAKELGSRLVVFAWGNNATQHAVINLIEDKHVVFFTENERFVDGENLRIVTQGNNILWERESPIVSKEDAQGRGIDKVGGKVFGLQKLDKLAFPVPPYFVLETSLMRRIVDDLGLRDYLDKLNNLPLKEAEQDAFIIREKILDYPKNSLMKMLPGLNDSLASLETDNFFIRSSANLEDGHFGGPTFAGNFSSLDASRETVSDGILQVIASAFSDNAIERATNYSINPADINMAVIVQKKIRASRSGAIFTADRQTGSPNFIQIEAVNGDENTVVSGGAGDKIHHVVVDRSSGKVVPNGKNVLPDEEVVRLANEAIRAESELHEGPQDIEFVIEQGTSQLYFLQTRPITIA